MTASAPSSPRPGRAAPAGRPAGALLVLLLVALLTALPCAGQSSAADGPARTAPAPAVAVSVVSAAQATAPAAHSGRTGHTAKASGQKQQLAAEQDHWILCTADGQPPRNNGCSSHPFCPQDAQLPNPPPQPQPAVSPLAAPAPEALPRVVPAGLLDGPHPAPDLHELQVHRS
ncbi:hypothetical protein ABT247_10110 [Kitasatospora sp. NPDC001539]|uniref:hypothetical protein n=1 Tax=Kitasatospora sp. NPDC001539 TaxID=3154384 RepID=UPI00331BE301